jgi:hypothetical protein
MTKSYLLLLPAWFNSLGASLVSDLPSNRWKIREQGFGINTFESHRLPFPRLNSRPKIVCLDVFGNNRQCLHKANIPLLSLQLGAIEAQ